MAINRSRLQARREELRVQLEQTQANLFALKGAIADLDFLLQEDNASAEASNKPSIKD